MEENGLAGGYQLNESTGYPPYKASSYDPALHGIKCGGEIKAAGYLTVTEMQCREEHLDKPG